MWVGLLAAAMFYASSPLLAEDAASLNTRAIPITGQPFTANLVRIDSNWKLTFRINADQDVPELRQIDAAQLVRWGRQPDWRKGKIVLLADGSRIVARHLKFRGRQLIVDSSLFSGAALPLESVRGVLLRPPPDPLSRDRLIAKIETAGEEGSDQLLLENGDVVRGVLVDRPPENTKQPARPADPFDNDLRTVYMRTEGGRLAVDVKRAIALTMNPALIERNRPGATAVLVGLRDGSQLWVQSIRHRQGNFFWTLTDGTVVASDPLLDSIWDEVSLLQPNSPQVKYLSDIKPLGYKHIPFLELAWPYKTDGNVLGASLRGDGRIYNKGLGMHSTSRLAYDLPSGYRALEAELAIDQLAGRRGSVVFRVYLTEGRQWRLAYESPVVRGGERPLPISIDLGQARRMALIVDMADRGDEWDHANWLDARLVK